MGKVSKLVASMPVNPLRSWRATKCFTSPFPIVFQKDISFSEEANSMRINILVLLNGIEMFRLYFTRESKTGKVCRHQISMFFFGDTEIELNVYIKYTVL